MSTSLIETVRTKYGQTASAGLSSDDAGVRAVAEAFGYSADELASIPAEANMGLSCGNPIALANLRAGETVVDLGSGGGLDVFLAAQRVGPSGKAYGVDMTPEMITLARRNAERGPGGKPFENVEFFHSTIDRIPLADSTVDVVISNCVINLAEDKPAVFREIFRILKPGGRVAVSDIALKKPLPDGLRDDVMAYVGCIAGAELIDDYVAQLNGAGFDQVAVLDSRADLNAYASVEGQSACCSPEPKKSVALSTSTGCCGGSGASSCCSSDTASAGPVAEPTRTMHKSLTDLLERYNVNDYAASVKVFAIKPRT